MFLFLPCWCSRKYWSSLPREPFFSANFISCKVFYNQPTDGERVCTLHSLIGPFWSHALFLIPRRTCFIALSPPSNERSNRNHGTTARVGSSLSLRSAVVVGGRKKKTGRTSPALWLILTDALHVSTGVWMLTRCCRGFGQRRIDLLLFQLDLLKPLLLLTALADMDSTASVKWIILQLKCVIVLNFSCF